MKGAKYDLEARVIMLEHGIEKLTAKSKIQKGNFMLYRVKISQQINDLKDVEIGILQSRVKVLEEIVLQSILPSTTLAPFNGKEPENDKFGKESETVQNLLIQGNDHGYANSKKVTSNALIPFTAPPVGNPVAGGCHTQNPCTKNMAKKESTGKKTPKSNSAELVDQSKILSKTINKPKRRSSRTKKNSALDFDIQVQAINLESMKLDEVYNENDSSENSSENELDLQPPPARTPAKRTRANSRRITLSSDREGQEEPKGIEKAKKNLTSNKTFFRNDSNTEVAPIKAPENVVGNTKPISKEAYSGIDDNVETQLVLIETPSKKLRGRKKGNSESDQNFERGKLPLKMPRNESEMANGSSRNSYTTEFDQFLAKKVNKAKDTSTTEAEIDLQEIKKSKVRLSRDKAENDVEGHSEMQDASEVASKNHGDKVNSSDSDSDSDSEDDFAPKNAHSPIKFPSVAFKKSKLTLNGNSEASNDVDSSNAQRKNSNLSGEGKSDAESRKEAPRRNESSDDDSSSDDSDDEDPKKAHVQQGTLVQQPRWMIEQRLDLSTRRSVTPSPVPKPIPGASNSQVRRTPAKKPRPGF